MVKLGREIMKRSSSGSRNYNGSWRIISNKVYNYSSRKSLLFTNRGW